MKAVLITSKLRFEDDGSPIGGSVVDLHLKAKGLAALGHTVTVVTAFSNANRMTGTLPYRVEERFILRRGLLSLQKGVYAFLKEFERDADVFYVDGHMFLYGAGLYRLCGGRVPVVGFFNIRLNAWADTSGNAASPPLHRRLKKTLRAALERTIGAPIANRLDGFIFNTPQVQALYHRFRIGTGKPNVIIEDLVATKELMRRFFVTVTSVRERERTATQVVFLSTGRMLPEKGFELLIRAYAKLRNRASCRLILSGGGPDVDRLKKVAAELGVGDAIAFPGWVEKETLYTFFSNAHVFVFPRWWIEYGSAVLTEALAFGLPCIVPAGGALERLAGGAALTFRDGDVDALSERMRELAEGAGHRELLAAQALARGEELDATALASRLERLLISAYSKG